MLLSRHQNERKDDKIKITNRSLENMSNLKHLGTIPANKN
jgi:hypothetical protein